MQVFPTPQCLSHQKKQESVNVCTYVWLSSLIPLVDVSVSVPVPCRFCYYSSVVQFEVGDSDASVSSCSDCFSYPGFFLISIWSWRLSFLDLGGIVLGFWCRLYQICRLLLSGWPFLLCLSDWSMSMGDLSISRFCHTQLHQIFFIIWSYCERCSFPHFLPNLFVICI